MKKGPGIFLAQFCPPGAKPPFDTLENACRHMASLGYTCVQIPSWDSGMINLETAAESKDYCQELNGKIRSYGITDGISELASHLQGQCMAVHPAYAEQFDQFVSDRNCRGNAKARTQWATHQLKLVIRASANLGLTSMPTFTGSLLFPYAYPWPQRPKGLVEAGFRELARRWEPVLREGDQQNVDSAFELHPGEDAFDGDSFDLFLAAAGFHKRININYDPSHFVLMHLDYVAFIERYKHRIKAYHVKDAELLRSAHGGTLGGYQPWDKSSRRFRSLGDGQVDFKAIESALEKAGLAELPHVLEWECCFKGKMQGAREGAPFIKALLDGSPLPEKTPVEKHSDGAFDDFASTGVDDEQIKRMLGL